MFNLNPLYSSIPCWSIPVSAQELLIVTSFTDRSTVYLVAKDIKIERVVNDLTRYAAQYFNEKI